MIERSLQFQWINPKIDARFQTGVSLHSHTSCSKENLGFIKDTARKVPGLREAVMAQEAKYLRLHGKPLDYTRGYWTPPLPPVEALALEREQIRGLGLRPLVSISDHDTMEACTKLDVVEGMGGVPFSVEWTVPFEGTYFHLGVHNLPPHAAHGWMAELAAFTAMPTEARLRELLAGLDSDPQILIVFNHPLWDEKGIGAARHGATTRRFLDRFGSYLHALELNGFRPWNENFQVIRLSRERNMVLISGGDRHGTEANSNLNLTEAGSFAEFVAEIRRDRLSHVLFMPQYNMAKPLRVMHTLVDIFREVPGSTTDQALWTDRVFFLDNDDRPQSLSSYWAKGQPWVVKLFVDAVMLLENRHLHSAVKIALSRQEVTS